MKTPNEIAHDLIRLADKLRIATAELAELDESAVRAKARFERAFAQAFLTAEGSAEARKQTAVLQAADEKLDAEIGAQRLRAAQEHLRYLRSSLDVGRTLSATVRTEWSVTETNG